MPSKKNSSIADDLQHMENAQAKMADKKEIQVTETDSTVKWEDPPAVTGRGRPGNEQWNKIAEELKQRPGKWALIRMNVPRDTHTVGRIRTGKIKAFSPKGSFEASSRRIEDPALGDDKVFNIYAKYVGENQEPPK